MCKLVSLTQVFNGMIDLKFNNKVVFTIGKSNVTVWILLVDERVLKTENRVVMIQHSSGFIIEFFSID